MNRKAALTTGPVGRTLISLTAPMVIGFFAIVAFNLADTYFVAQLGTKQLAAMAFTFPVVMLVAGIALGLGMGTAAVVSQAVGQGNSHEVQKLTTHSLVMAVSVVVAFSSIGIATIGPLFTALGATHETLAFIKKYMTVWYVGMIFLVFPMVGNNAIRATGDTRYPSLIMATGAAINFVLDPFLIFGLGVFPKLGLTGAALATVISRSVTMIMAMAILYFRHHMVIFTVPAPREIWNSWRRILHIGIPAAGTNVLTPLCVGAVTRMASEFGEEAVAAVGAGARVEAFALLLLMALSAVMVPFTGQNWGAQRLDRIVTARKYSFRFSVLWGVLCIGVLAVWAGPLARLFSHDPQVVENITLYLCIVPIGYGFQGIFRLTCMIFNGISRPLHSAALNIVRMVALYVPFAYTGGRFFGFVGILGGVALANICAGIISFILIRRPLGNTTTRSTPPVVT